MADASVKVSRFVSMRVPAELYDRLSQAADEQHRNRTQQLLMYLEQGLEADGYMPSEPTQEVPDVE